MQIQPGLRLRLSSASTRSSTAWLVAVPSTSWAISRVIGSPGRGQLVEQGDGIAQRAGGLAGDQGQRVWLDLDAFGGQPSSFR